MTTVEVPAYPRAVLAKSEIRRGLCISTWEGASGQVHNALISNAFLSGFLLAWGANDFHIGLLGAIPFLGQHFQVVGAYVVDRWKERRREIVASLGFIARSTWFLMALLPLLFSTSSRSVVPAILTVFLLYQIVYCASGPGWVAWLAVLVPERLRGRYLGRRNLVTELLGILTAVVAGVAIDQFKHGGHERVGFAMLQSIAGGAGIACFVLMLHQPDPGHSAPAPELHWAYLFRPLQDSRFRSLCAFNVYWCFGLNICLPFLNAHLLKNLHWNFTQLALLGVIASAASVLMNPIWGRMADRRGCKLVLEVCALGMMHVPLYYAFCPSTLRWPIYLSSLLYGVFLSGFNVAMFSLTLGSLPADSRAMGAAVLSAVTGPATFVSGALSGWLAQYLTAVQWRIGTMVFINYQFMFLLSIACRIPALALLNRLQSTPVGRTKLAAPWIHRQPDVHES